MSHREVCVVRADASSQIGKGHVVRCGALARALDARGLPCILAGQEETGTNFDDEVFANFISLDGGPDEELRQLQRSYPGGVAVLVIDHYGRASDYERRLADWAELIVAVDGTGREHEADIVVAPGPGLAPPISLQSKSALLAGGDYALIRPEFAAVRSRRLEQPKHADRLLVGFGGSDVSEQVAETVKGLQQVSTRIGVDVLLGPNATAPQVTDAGAQVKFHSWSDAPFDLFERASCYLGAGGGTALEAAAIGLPAILVSIAGNQRNLTAALATEGAAIVIDEINLARDVAVEVPKLMNDPQRLSRMSCKARSTVGVDGAPLVAQRILTELARKRAQ